MSKLCRVLHPLVCKLVLKPLVRRVVRRHLGLHLPQSWPFATIEQTLPYFETCWPVEMQIVRDFHWLHCLQAEYAACLVTPQHFCSGGFGDTFGYSWQQEACLNASDPWVLEAKNTTWSNYFVRKEKQLRSTFAVQLNELWDEEVIQYLIKFNAKA